MHLTDEQRRLARHALGLPNDMRRSYRNRFSAPPGTTCRPAWDDMAAKGYATLDVSVGLNLGLFHLTVEAAEFVLEPRESLDPEDFR